MTKDEKAILLAAGMFFVGLWLGTLFSLLGPAPLVVIFITFAGAVLPLAAVIGRPTISDEEAEEKGGF